MKSGTRILFTFGLCGVAQLVGNRRRIQRESEPKGEKRETKKVAERAARRQTRFRGERWSTPLATYIPGRRGDSLNAKVVKPGWLQPAKNQAAGAARRPLGERKRGHIQRVRKDLPAASPFSLDLCSSLLSLLSLSSPFFSLFALFHLRCHRWLRLTLPLSFSSFFRGDVSPFISLYFLSVLFGDTFYFSWMFYTKYTSVLRYFPYFFFLPRLYDGKLFSQGGINGIFRSLDS